MIIVRAYSGKALLFQEKVDVAELNNEQMKKIVAAQLDRLIPSAKMGLKHMVEIEFLDEPDVNQRFVRFGTDTSRMRWPQQVDSLSDWWEKRMRGEK